MVALGTAIDAPVAAKAHPSSLSRTSRPAAETEPSAAIGTMPGRDALALDSEVFRGSETLSRLAFQPLVRPALGR
jgi:hypothetical protein